MTSQNGIKKTVGGAVLAGALSLTSLFGGIASADMPSVSEVVVTKLMDSTSPSFDGDGDVDGRDFLVWQRGESPASTSVGDLADWQANYGVTSAAAAADPTSAKPVCYLTYKLSR